MGFKKRQAEVLTSDEKELLWKKGLLGVASPIAMIFYYDQFFALHSGKERR